MPSIGLEKKELELNIDIDNKGKNENRQFNISLLYSSGLEKYRSISYSSFHGADSIFIIYNITKRDSFDLIEFWVDNTKKALGSECVIFLFGNKADLKEGENAKREVTEEEAKKACENYQLIWGGEQNLEELGGDKLGEFIGEYVKIIYEKVGEKKVVKRGIGFEKKKKKNCICF